MKTNSTIKHILLAFIIVCSMAACKKDKGGSEPIPEEVKAMTFTELKALSTGTSVKVPDAKKIKGIIISDASAKNIDSKTVILQEAVDKPGIIITFDAAQTFTLNDEVEVTISNQTLAQVNGEIILQNVPVANAKKTGTGTIAARTTTATDIVANKAAWNGTLVKLGTGSFTTGPGNYKGILQYSDASGAIKSNILAGATFENQDYPVRLNALTGVVRINGADVYLDLRKASDAESAYAYTLTEDFQTYPAVEPLPSAPNEVTLAGGVQWFKLTGNAAFSIISSTNSSDITFLDAPFLTAGKRYVYSLGVGVTLMPFYSNTGAAEITGRAKGIKSVTITSAGSLSDKTFKLVDQLPVIDRTLTAFDPTKSGYNVALTARESGLKISPTIRYFNQGVWNTVTFNIPDKAELISTYKFTEEQADAFIASPVFNITARNETSAIGTEQRRGGAGFVTPQIYSKIQFNYETKPTWAP